MAIFNDDGSYGFNYWAVDQPSTYSAPPAETPVTFILGTHDEETEVTFGDVIYCFRDDRLLMACEVLEMLTPPSHQAVVSDSNDDPNANRCILTAVRARVMPVFPYILYTSDCTMDDGMSFQESIQYHLHKSRRAGWGIRGVAWEFDPMNRTANEMLNMLDDHARAWKNGPECAEN